MSDTHSNRDRRMPRPEHGPATPPFDDPAAIRSVLTGPDGAEFVGELVHEFRSRLTSIICAAEMMYSELSGALNDMQRSQAGVVYSSALLASVLASSVMELVRDDGASAPADDGMPLSVDDLLYAVGETIRPIALHRGLGLRVEPTVAGRRLGQPVVLDRVLLNLAVVVLENLDEGHLEIAAREVDATCVEFSVSGRPPDGIAEPFDGVDPPVRPRSDGSGWQWSIVGTALVTARLLLEAMGAELHHDVDSAERMIRLGFELDLPTAP